MKMKKRIALLLALTMVAGMTGCGAASTETTTTDSSGTEETGETTEGSGEKLYIPLLAKGFQHQYWQTVYAGAKDAAEEYGVELYFDGPPSETDIDAQVNMFKQELAKNPVAMGLAALSPESLYEVLDECAEKNIPVVCFDAGVPDDPSGAVVATASTDNEAAASIAAEKFGECEKLVEKMKNATPENPVVIGVIPQDAVSATQIGRGKGFVDKMKEIASQYGTVTVTGHEVWKDEADNASIIIDVEVPATTEAVSVQTVANSLLSTKGLAAVFLCNEGAVTGFLAAVSDGEDLAEGGKYAELVVAGFDAGAAQKNAVRQGWFLGSVSQNPYMIGYDAVEMCVKAAKGETVSDIDTGAVWYDASNMDDPEIAQLVYD